MAPDEDAPFGYMKDEKTGERRPKKRPGRQRVRKPAEPEPAAEPEPEQQAGPESGPAPLFQEPAELEREPLERTEDRAPDTGRKRGGRGRSQRGRAAAAAIAPKEPKPVIPFRAGPIAKGMNKLYRKIGKLLRVANRPLGQAFIDVTTKEDDDDLTVGEAWEELARVNPAIRGVLMKMVTGGAYGGLFFAHLPILIAVLMLDPVASRFPLGKILLALAEDGEDDDQEQDGEDGEFPSFPLGGLLAGMSQADMAQAMAFAQQMGDQIGMRATGSVQRGGDAA